MFFVSTQRLVCAASGVVSRIVSVRSFSIITLSPKSINSLASTRLLEFRSAFGRTVFVDHIVRCSVSKKVQDNIPAVQMKKRPLRRKRAISDDEESPQPGFWNVKALATAEEYNLEALMEGLVKQDLYAPSKINASSKCK